jgi:hypothetical protein
MGLGLWDTYVVVTLVLQLYAYDLLLKRKLDSVCYALLIAFLDRFFYDLHLKSRRLSMADKAPAGVAVLGWQR